MVSRLKPRDAERAALDQACTVVAVDQVLVASPSALRERAAALRTQLRTEQDEAETRGYYSEPIHQRMLDGGLYRVIQPRLFGGFELDLPDFLRVLLEICRGDPGSGWCYGLGAAHVLIAASHWPAEAQEKLFGEHGYIIAPHRPRPAGNLKPEGDGYRLTGEWDYCSGAPYSTHFFGAAMLVDDANPPRPVHFALPRSSYKVLGDWGGNATLGMAASGSHSIGVEDAFVPGEFVIEAPALWSRPEDMLDGTPGTRLHGNPMYLGRVMGPYHAVLAVIVVGAAWAALDEFETILATRDTLTPPFVRRSSHFEHQRPFGEAMAMTEAAEAIVFGQAEQYMELCRRWQRTGEPISVEDNFRLWTTAQQAGKLASEAVELILRSAGSSAAKRGSKIQRYFRDVAMYRGHPSSQFENFAIYRSRAHFGLPVGMLGL